MKTARFIHVASAASVSLAAIFGPLTSAVAADAEICHDDCPSDVDPPPEDDPTECSAIVERQTDLAEKMAAVWGPSGAPAAQPGRTAASRTGGMIYVRSPGNGPNGQPAFILRNGAHGIVRIALTKIGPGAREAGRSGLGEAKSDDEYAVSGGWYGPVRQSPYVPRGAPTWTAGLGRDASGQFAGQLELRAAALYTATGALTAASVEIHRDTKAELDLFRRNGVQYVMSKECLAEISDSAPEGGVHVSFYLPSQVLDDLGADGEYVLKDGAAPFVEYSVSCDSSPGDRRVRITERRDGATVSVCEFFRREEDSCPVFGVSEGGGLRVRRLKVLSESASSRTVLETVSGSGGAVRSTLKGYTVLGARELLALSVDDPYGEARTNSWEYVTDVSIPGYGYVSRHTSPGGLVTEYTYDHDGRKTSIRESVPGGALPVRLRRFSYVPLGVRPHAPDSPGAGISADTGDEDFFSPRVETEYIGGIAVSRVLRFVSTDTMDHRIVEEVRLADPSSSDFTGEWDSPANARRYTDYMPYDRCKPCSERPSLTVREDGVTETYSYSSGTYEPGPDGTPGTFNEVPGGEWFRTVKTRYPAGAVSYAGNSAIRLASPFRTTREVTVEVRSSKKTVLRETWVCTGSGSADFERVLWTATTLDAEGRESLVLSSDGSRTEKTWSCGRLVSECGPSGVLTTYAYDALGRVTSAVKSGGGFAAETTSTIFDMDGRVLSRTVSAGGIWQTGLRSYDSLGRLASETSEDGVVTRRLYSVDPSAGTETVATVRGWGTDCAVTNTTVSHADGRLLSSSLNGVTKTVVAYGADEGGMTWQKTFLGPAGTNSPRWTLSRTSPLGHEVETRSPGFGGFDLVTSNLYNSAGQLLATQTFGGDDAHILSSRLYAYDSFGERILDVTDLDLDGDVGWTSDRIVSNDVRYVSSGGELWRESTSWAARTDGSAELSPVGGTRTRLTGLGYDQADGTLVAETVSADAFGNEVTSRVWRVRSACAETRERTVPGSSLPERAEFVRGREVSRRSSTGVETTTEYDALGRVVAVEDGRGNVTATAYDANGRVASVTDGAGNTTVYGYDALGRRVSETDPNGLVTTTAYDAEGRVVSRRGATYPVDYEYDEWGDRVAMATYRDAALSQGDVMLWLRDEATGLVTNKVYADGAGPTYAYTPDGRLALRTWARGVSTFYSYDGAGNLVSTTYSDDTPSIACAYDRSGNIVSAVTDGVATNLYAYSSEGLVTNEVQNGATLARSYDYLGRPTGYTLTAPFAPLREISFSYDSLGRLFTITSGTHVFAYSYLFGTDLVSGYTCCGFSRTVAYEPYRDLVSAITNRFGSRVISTFEYTNDAAGRRVAISRGGEAMGPLSGATDAYGYNGRNEVVSARRTLGGSPVAGFDEDFAYDPIGNRISATDYDETGAARTSTYAANGLNQYISRTVPGWASVRGLADADATVAVNGNAAYMTTGGPRTVAADEETAYFFGSDDFDNSTGGGFAELEVSATVSDGTNDLVSVVTNKVFVPPANEIYAYDADGNMMEDARFRYYWNGENRMIRAEEKIAPQGRLPYIVTYAYDHMGRNVVKNGSKFIWDDYNIIVEDAASSNATFNAWGLDLDGTMQGTGGVGGLLAVEKGAAAYLPAYDANGNVTEYVTVDGAVAAHYAYSAFGKQMMAEDAIGFSHRFSTKPYCPKTGLVEFEFRKYAPNAGRWCSRDIIEVVPLYCMVYNRLVLEVDLLGAVPASLPSSYYNKYTNPTKAVRRRGQYINPRSKQEHREYCGCVCKKKNPETCKDEYFTTQARGRLSGCRPLDAPCPDDSAWVAYWHTHGGNDPQYDNENFSPSDRQFSDGHGIDGYLITPGDRFKHYIPGGGVINRGDLYELR